MATVDPLLVCGDARDQPHKADCLLGQAENVALAAAEAAATLGKHRLGAALAALVDAGLLHDVAGDDWTNELMGVIDGLYNVGLIDSEVSDRA